MTLAYQTLPCVMLAVEATDRQQAALGSQCFSGDPRAHLSSRWIGESPLHQQRESHLSQVYCRKLGVGLGLALSQARRSQLLSANYLHLSHYSLQRF